MLLSHWTFLALLVSGHAKPRWSDLADDLEDGNRGSLDNCGDPATNLKFQWSPKAIAPGDVITLYLETDSVLDYNDGKGCMELWVPEYPKPIFKACEPLPCSEVNSVFPNTCPFKKGEHISVDGHKVHWTPQAIAPPNNIIVKFNMFNEAGQETLCAKGPVTIRPIGPSDQPTLATGPQSKKDPMGVVRFNQ